MNYPPLEFNRDNFVVSTDPRRLELAWIYDYLANEAYWSRGIPYDVFQRSIQNSLCFGLYQLEKQIGFARVITDFATFAYLGDVFVAPEYRQRELGKWLVECIISHPELQGLRRWMLATSDAHGLYRKYGFAPLKHPENLMEMLAKGN